MLTLELITDGVEKCVQMRHEQNAKCYAAVAPGIDYGFAEGAIPAMSSKGCSQREHFGYKVLTTELEFRKAIGILVQSSTSLRQSIKSEDVKTMDTNFYPCYLDAAGKTTGTSIYLKACTTVPFSSWEAGTEQDVLVFPSTLGYEKENGEGICMLFAVPTSFANESSLVSLRTADDYDSKKVISKEDVKTFIDGFLKKWRSRKG